MSINNRIKEIRNTLFSNSTKEFAIALKVSSQAVSNYVRDGYNVGREVVGKILSVAPDVNAAWLLTGEGEMLKNSGIEIATPADGGALNTGKIVPFYDAPTAAGYTEVDMRPVTHPTKTIQIGGFLSDSEAAIQVFGNSMVPNYPAGCIIGTRENQDNFIVPGKVYVIETRDGRYLKRVHLNKDKTCLRCISDNHMTYESGPLKGEYCYPEFDIHIDDVVRLHKVVGVIKRNLM